MISGSALGTVTQPYSGSTVLARTGAVGASTVAFSGSTNGLMFAGITSGTLGIFSGTILNTGSGLTEGSFHALQGMWNGASSSVQGDGNAAVNGNAGAGNIGGLNTMLCDDGFGEFFTGNVAEAWFGTGNQSATFNTAHSNQSTAYGTP